MTKGLTKRESKYRRSVAKSRYFKNTPYARRIKKDKRFVKREVRALFGRER